MESITMRKEPLTIAVCEQKNSAYSRLSIGKNRMTVVISVPCANAETLVIADAIAEQADKVIDYVETHELQAL